MIYGIREFCKNNSFSYFTSKCDFQIYQEFEHFYCNFHVPPIFYGFILGKQGHTLKGIQSKTQTLITLPKSNSNKVLIKGNTHESVSNALKELLKVVEYGREKARLTHFLSIPTTVKEEIRSNFKSFKDRVLVTCGDNEGIEEKLFQKAHKLHLTLATMVLGDNNEVNDTIQCINRFKEHNPCLFKCPFHVKIKGLGFWGKDPSSAKVLFAHVQLGLDHDRLQDLANKLQDFLYDERIIVKKESDTISLHMTLMNVSFLNFGNHRTRARRNHRFDCSKIINICADWDFGIFEIDEIQLSEMKSVTDSSYYVNANSFKF